MYRPYPSQTDPNIKAYRPWFEMANGDKPPSVQQQPPDPPATAADESAEGQQPAQEPATKEEQK